MNQTSNNHEDPRLAEILDIILKFAAGDFTARGTLAGDDSALDSVMAGINILGEELEAKVADNKQTMQALSDSEVQFSSLFEAILDGICMADAQTRRFRMANDAICRMLGYSLDEFLNLTVDDIHPKKDLPNVARQFDRQLKGEINLARLPVKRKDGTVFQADITATPATVDGQLCITGVVRDVTERIRADDEIHELNRTLQEKVRQLLEAKDELVRKELNLQLAKELAERQAAEHELHSANEQLSVLLDSLPIAVYRCAAGGDYAVAYMSQNVVSFTGYTARNFMDQPNLWFSHIHPDDAQRVSDEMALLLDKGRHAYEYRWLNADGNYLWIRDSLRLVRLEDGSPNYLVGMWQNITEDTLAAEALRKANDDLSLFRRLLDNSSDAIEVIDPVTLRFLDVNETACRELGYSREELLTMSVQDIDPDMDKDTLLMLDEQFEESGSARFETTHRRKDGAIFPVEVNMGIVTLEKTYRLGIVRDITERKRVEDELRRQEHLLSESQRLGHIGSWFYDITGPMAWSDEFYRIFGISPDTVTPNVESLISLIHPDDRKSMQNWIAACVAGEKPDALDFRINWPDGTIRYIRGWGEVVLDSENRPIYLAGIGQDITERKIAEEKMQQYIADLAKRNKELQDALADIRQLTGMLPICASCKKIRNDTGYWSEVESYISEHTDVVFTSGLCPECEGKMYEDLEKLKNEKT
jgi:PAS domain S-box-containing protein